MTRSVTSRLNLGSRDRLILDRRIWYDSSVTGPTAPRSGPVGGETVRPEGIPTDTPDPDGPKPPAESGTTQVTSYARAKAGHCPAVSHQGRRQSSIAHAGP